MRLLARAAALLIAGMNLAACNGGHGQDTAPSPPTARSTAATSGVGKAAVVINGATVTFPTTCTRHGKVTEARGDTGITSARLVVSGPILSVVITQRAASGGSTTLQAIDGLRNRAGKVVGRIAVVAHGDKYQGQLTYVSNRLDKAGKAVAQPSDTSTGSFTLNCSL